MADLQALLVEDEGPELSDEELQDAPPLGNGHARLAGATIAVAGEQEEPEEGEVPGGQAAPHDAGGDVRAAARASRPLPPPAGEGGAGRGRSVKRPRDGVRERLDAAFSAEVKHAAARIAEQLKEKKVHLIRRLCDRFGVELADEVLQETLVKESAGGMLTADGSRRREAGGTYLTLFAARVPKAALKEALAAAARDLREIQAPGRAGEARAGVRARHPPPVPTAAADV